MEEAEVTTPSHDIRVIAMLAHVLQIFTWFTGPLIIYLAKRDSPFVAFHALQVLLFQAALFVFGILLTAGCFVVIIASVATQGGAQHPSSGLPVGFFVIFGVTWMLWMGGWIVALALGIVYGIKAMNGEWAGYPLVGQWARRLALKSVQSSGVASP